LTRFHRDQKARLAVGKALIAAQRWVALQLAHLQEFDESAVGARRSFG
jgi:hypothetical protein